MTMDFQRDSLRFRTAESVRGQCLSRETIRDVQVQIRVRLAALEEVLCRLPPPTYQVLCRSGLKLRWNVEGAWLGRVVSDCGGPVVELAERLEQEAWPIVVSVVAHELAHVVLGHAADDDPSVQRQQEQQAASELRTWGFAAEADLAEFLLAHQEG